MLNEDKNSQRSDFYRYLHIYFCIIIETSTGCIENVYYATQALMSITITITALVALMQYKESVKNNKSTEEIRFIENAVSLAKYYKDNILVNAGFIEALYEETGIAKILEKARNCNFFNTKEIDDIFTKKEVEKLKEIGNSTEFILTSHKLYKLYFEHSIFDDEEEMTKDEVGRNFMLTKEIIVDTLNSMEYFAMSFAHKTADESVVFESLAPSYLKLVKLLYYQIASRNMLESESTFYTNVISLYKRWNNNINEKNERIQLSKEQIVNKGTVHKR